MSRRTVWVIVVVVVVLLVFGIIGVSLNLSLDGAEGPSQPAGGY